MIRGNNVEVLNYLITLMELALLDYTFLFFQNLVLDGILTCLTKRVLTFRNISRLWFLSLTFVAEHFYGDQPIKNKIL